MGQAEAFAEELGIEELAQQTIGLVRELGTRSYPDLNDLGELFLNAGHHRQTMIDLQAAYDSALHEAEEEYGAANAQLKLIEEIQRIRNDTMSYGDFTANLLSERYVPEEMLITIDQIPSIEDIRNRIERLRPFYIDIETGSVEEPIMEEPIPKTPIKKEKAA